MSNQTELVFYDDDSEEEIDESKLVEKDYRDIQKGGAPAAADSKKIIYLPPIIIKDGETEVEVKLISKKDENVYHQLKDKGRAIPNGYVALNLKLNFNAAERVDYDFGQQATGVTGQHSVYSELAPPGTFGRPPLPPGRQGPPLLPGQPGQPEQPDHYRDMVDRFANFDSSGYNAGSPF